MNISKAVEKERPKLNISLQRNATNCNATQRNATKPTNIFVCVRGGVLNRVCVNWHQVFEARRHIGVKLCFASTGYLLLSVLCSLYLTSNHGFQQAAEETPSPALDRWRMRWIGGIFDLPSS
jgi:hypothetical protein